MASERGGFAWRCDSVQKKTLSVDMLTSDHTTVMRHHVDACVTPPQARTSKATTRCGSRRGPTMEGSGPSSTGAVTGRLRRGKTGPSVRRYSEGFEACAWDSTASRPGLGP